MHPLPNLDFPPFPTLAYLLRIFWPPFTFSTPNLAPLFFRHGVLPLPTCTPGLKSPQALRRTNLKAAFFLFWLQLGQTKWPHYKLAPATPTISGFTAREMSQRLCGWISASSWCSYRQCPLIANVKIVMRKNLNPKIAPRCATECCYCVVQVSYCYILRWRLENANINKGLKVHMSFYQCYSFLDWLPKLDYWFITSASLVPVVVSTFI